MTVTVNGQARLLDDGGTVESLLAVLGVASNGIAVAVNARVVRRGTFAQANLHDGDVVEIIRAVAGG